MKSKNDGFAIVAVLIVILIGVMIYMVDFSAMFGHIDKNRAYEERPWFEEQRLVSKENLPVKQTGKGGKTLILNQKVLAGPVQRKDENRGEIEIIVEPNGLAKGHWQCEYDYEQGKIHYTITANFEGNIDPTKNFTNPEGTNKKLLYFITKGKYKQIKTDEKRVQWPTEAPVYVVGWIDKDYSAKGKIFLMSNEDKESHGNAEYDWKTK
ncbi:MAG: hypothetical protein A2Y10_13510 [Planctomycetes bacterium GWF2_41_51]|nr:MAG: hypothetical protein A2Y10_13510 [Planctomycetes bacterium GWF2_41_51]HBG26173.1 hypothetical protein [Phycisphaerales bacterium]